MTSHFYAGACHSSLLSFLSLALGLFFGLSGPVEGQRQVQPHLKGSGGVSGSSLVVRAATLRDITKIEHIILCVCVVKAL